MEFQFDEIKSTANLKKHGIDFHTAQALWEDEYAYEIQVEYEGESRFIVIGKIEELFWTAVITYRNQDVRIISVRRSRKKEIKIYEQAKD